MFSLYPIRNIDKTHLCRIVFPMFLIKLRVKSPITKIIEDNIFEVMDILVLNILFYLLLDFQNKNNINLNDVLIVI